MACNTILKPAVNKPSKLQKPIIFYKYCQIMQNKVEKEIPENKYCTKSFFTYSNNNYTELKIKPKSLKQINTKPNQFNIKFYP